MNERKSLRQLIRCWLQADGEIHRTLTIILMEVRKIMTDVATLTADFNKYQGDVGTALKSLSDQVAALQAQIASSGSIKPEDLDALDASIKAADAALAPPPATEPPVAG